MTVRASSISGGSTSRSSSSRSSRRSRGSTHDTDMGSARAVSTTSIRSLSSSSARRRASSVISWTFRVTAPPAARDGSGCRAGALDETFETVRRDERGDVAAPLRDLLHQARGEEAVFRVSRHEQRVDPGEAAIHLGHLQLVVEVADGAQALDDDGDVVTAAVVDDEALEG